jgi:hypothetical protein
MFITLLDLGSSKTMKQIAIAVLSILVVFSMVAYTSDISASAAGWSRPVTVAYEAPLSQAESGFVESPNARWVDLVTFRERTGFVLYPWLNRGSFGSPVEVPRAKHQRGSHFYFEDPYPDAAINDAGSIVLSWSEVDVPPHKKVSLGYDECFCAVRAVVRLADGRFGPVRTLAPPSGPTSVLLGVEIGSDGLASALWEESGEGFKFAETTRSGRFLTSQHVSSSGYSALLGRVNGNPQVILSEPKEPESERETPTLVYVTEAPFVHKTLVATLVPHGQISRDGTALVGDGHGDELLISTDWEYGEVQTAYRPAGGSFGPVRTIARTGPPGSGVDCDLNATMNEHGEAVAAWACDPSNGKVGGPPDFGQAALFGPGGVVDDLTGPRPATDGEAPWVALNDDGRSLIMFEMSEYNGLISLAGSHGRFGHYDTIIREPLDPGHAGVAITHAGTALVTWTDQSPDGTKRIRVAHMHL